MKRVHIARMFETPNAVFGRLTVIGYDGEFLMRCYTVERPWEGNRPNVSCIPTGTYRAKLGTFKGKYANYELQDVPGRSAIEFHIANFASELEGCIAPGRYIDYDAVKKELGVFSSRNAFQAVMTFLNYEPEVEFVVEWMDNEVCL